MSFLIQNLSAGYSSKKIVTDITIKVNVGQTCSIIGKNGSGKSTLFNSMMGLLKMVTGKIYINGDIIQKPLWKEKFTYKLSYIPQHNRIIKKLSVLKNLKLAAWYRSKVSFYDKLEALMAQNKYSKLKSSLNQKAGTLSGGEQFLLALACSEIAIDKVDYYFFDEPTAGMDRRNMEEICEVLTELSCDQKKTVLMIEQDLNTAFKVADKVVVMVPFGDQVYTSKDLDDEKIKNIKNTISTKSNLSSKQINLIKKYF